MSCGNQTSLSFLDSLESRTNGLVFCRSRAFYPAAWQFTFEMKPRSLLFELETVCAEAIESLAQLVPIEPISMLFRTAAEPNSQLFRRGNSQQRWLTGGNLAADDRVRACRGESRPGQCLVLLGIVNRSGCRLTAERDRAIPARRSPRPGAAGGQ